MRRQGLGSIGFAALALALAMSGCTAPSASVEPVATTTVEVEAIGMAYHPAVIEVAPGTRLVIEFTNADMHDVHDLVFENGAGSERLWPGDTETIEVGVVSADLDGWCTVAGHRAQGMELRVVVTEDASITSG